MLSGQTIVVLGPSAVTTPLVTGLQRASAREAFHLHTLDPAIAPIDDCGRLAQQADVIILAEQSVSVTERIDGLRAEGTLRSGSLTMTLLTPGVPVLRASAKGVPAGIGVRAVCSESVSLGAGMTVLAAGRTVDQNAVARAQALFESVGQVLVVEDRVMETVAAILPTLTGVMDRFTDALAQGGVAAGLTRDAAETLAAQTVLGAATMVAQTGEHPAMLKDRVTSPAGTTIAGLYALEQGGLRAALITAVADAAVPPSGTSSS